ncbi:NAD(P)H-dependent oxidoreductase [Paenibacillus camerounensis]|uniref:NAD(P)H-dependent oxidoreductase n=1 Tax=Paenibacillus camerounensis TaxID=1243663 RepID=UPI0005AB07EC|nr:NAD(P)H-dependent oxidoreductase [Paenibacillus camerounensis]
MKTLVITAHPNLDQSIVNKRWVEELNKYSGELTIHNLYKEYPNEQIDIERERQLVSEHDRIVFQFPLYWYSTPPLLKKWQDWVLTGWVGGATGSQLMGKELLLAISAGTPKKYFEPDGLVGYSMEELLRPIQALSKYIGIKLLPPFVQYGTPELSDEDIEISARQYLKAVLS